MALSQCYPKIHVFHKETAYLLGTGIDILGVARMYLQLINFLPEQFFSNVTIQVQRVIWTATLTQTVPNYRVQVELNL